VSRDRATAVDIAKARYLFIGSSVALMLAGLVMIYSASSVSDFVLHGDSAYHLKRQFMWIGLGSILLLLAWRVDYRALRRLAWPALFVTIGGLVVVLVIGIEGGGAQRWVDIGGYTIQPSEYAKLACVMVAAHMLAQRRSRQLADKDMWGRLFVSTGLVMFLVMLQPDMGTTVSIAAAIYVVLLLGGVDWRALGGVLAGGAAIGTAAVLIAPYRAARLFAFLDPWADPQGAGYQTIQAMLAFGSGGIAGVGLGMSRQKFFYLPAAHTDFIFAIIGEELGLVGALGIVAAFVVFAYAGIRIALGARDTFGRLLAGGITAMIVIQAIMNMAAVTSLMPVTGIPMPLVSYGGSTMTFTMLCIGVVLSVSRYGTRGVRVVRGKNPNKEQSHASDDEWRGNRRSHLSGVVGGRGAARQRA